ncbi:MAG: TIM-barrel domain-containing protein [Cyclobacteriaceae bacterium]
MYQSLGTLNRYQSTSENSWQLSTDQNISLLIQVMTDDIIRFRFKPSGRDFSYAIDPGFRPQVKAAGMNEEKDHLHLTTSSLSCRISKKGLTISFYDLEGNLLNEDQQSFSQVGEMVSCHKKLQTDEAFFGLGDKPTDFNLRGKKLQNWGTDAFYYQKDTDPLYRNIPFYIGLHHSRAYGIFLDNSFRTHFDFGRSQADTVSFAAEGGELNYYFIGGPGVQQVAERYTLLTGRPDLPPLWGLGYHQCKWSYYPEANVRALASRFREEQIPCDAIYLDIDYMEGYRCFTWSKEGFKDPARMISDLKKEGFKTIVILDPGIKIDPEYEVYQDGLEGDHFCRTRNGEVFEGEVWPGPCHFPDFTRPATREWWKNQVHKLVDVGVAGIWNDMNEPSVFDTQEATMPPEVMHDYEGEPAPHAKAHNVYGMQMARATFEGLRKWQPEKRPVVITRSGYSGLQRHTLVWTGDNTSTWKHMWLASIQCQRLSLSGVSYCGSDIGGFIKDSEPELFVRWIQLGSFHPLFRTHSMADKADQAPNLSDELREAIQGGADREPWAFGEKNKAIIRKYISLRYRLLPYFYSAFWQYVKRGTPILRPLLMLEQENPHFYEHASHFAVGDHLIVAPVLEADAKNLSCYLPKGKWYYYWTGEVLEGGKETIIPLTLEDMPLLVRAGAVLPLQPLMQYVGEKKVDKLSLQVFFAEGKVKSELYEDAYDGYEHHKGQYVLKTFEVTGESGKCVIRQQQEGAYQPEYRVYEIELRGFNFEPTVIMVDDEEVSFTKQQQYYRLEVKADFATILVE